MERRTQRVPQVIRDVNCITLLSACWFILDVLNRSGCFAMLLLSAILRYSLLPEARPNDLMAQTRLRLGHMGLTIVALVFVLVTFWQR